jgi:hypothetical protein
MTNATNGNGATEESTKSTALDSSKERFKARKSPAPDKEVIAAVTAYFKADDKVSAAQAAVAEAMAERTQACKELVALRGAGQINTKSRGMGRVNARGDSCYLVFPTAETGPQLAV